MTRCNRCLEHAVGTVDREPLCANHLPQVQAQLIERQQEEFDRIAREYIEKIPPDLLLHPEYGPALWLLGAPSVAKRAWVFVDPTSPHVQWEALLDDSRDWSEPSRMLVELAFNLWSGRTSADDARLALISPHRWGARLDPWSFRRVLQALAMSGGRRVIVFNPKSEAFPR